MTFHRSEEIEKNPNKKQIGYKIHGKSELNDMSIVIESTVWVCTFHQPKIILFSPISLMFGIFFSAAAVGSVLSKCNGKIVLFSNEMSLCFGAGSFFFYRGKTEPKPHHTQYVVKFPCVYMTHEAMTVYSIYNCTQTYCEQLFNTFSLEKARRLKTLFHFSIRCMLISVCNV